MPPTAPGANILPAGTCKVPPVRAFGLLGRPAFGDFAPLNDYAQRTARYAHSTASDRQATDLGKSGSSGRSWKGGIFPASRSRPRRRRSNATIRQG